MKESNDVLDSDSENMEESLIVLPSNSDSKNTGESKMVLPSDSYFERKRQLIEMNTYTRRTKEWLVYVTLAICIAMVIIGKIMYFVFCHCIYLFYKYGG